MKSTIQPSTRVPSGYAIAFASASVLSTTAIFLRTLAADYSMPPLVLAFWRDVFVAACLAAFLLLAKPALLRTKKSDRPFLALFGLALAFFNSFLTISVAENGAAVSTILVYSSAIFTAVLGRTIKAERLGAVRILIIAVCLGGCALAAGILEPGAWRASGWGIASGLLSGLGYAVYSMVGEEAGARGIDPRTSLLYAFGSASIFLLGFGCLPGSVIPGNPAPPALFMLGGSVAGWLLLLALAAGPTLIGFGLYVASLRRLGASRTNLIVMTEVGITAVLAWAILGERLSAWQVAGAALLFAGIVAMRVKESSKEISKVVTR